jgi:hypothetical protein
MIHVSTNKRNGKKRRLGRHITRFPGICSDALDLGVHRMHLYQVLTGRHQSYSLLRRYQALKAEQQRSAS